MLASGDEAGQAAVIISGGGWPGAYDIVRALGVAGVASIVASSQRDDIAFASRYVRERVVLPPLSPGYEGEILGRLKRLGLSREERAVLFYVGDAEVAFVQRYRDELEPYFRFLLPSAEVGGALLNKSLFYDLAVKHGLPVPHTEVFADAAEMRARVDSLPFPSIVKPSFNWDWFWRTPVERERFPPYKRALRRFDSKEALLEFCEALPRRASGFLVQSYIEGSDEGIASFHGYFDEQSKCLGRFLGREVRTNPPRTGESAYSRTIHDADLAERSIGYLTRIGMRGIVKIDYKLDVRAREFKILEIEPHFQFWHLLGAYAGVNLPLMAYLHQRGAPVSADKGYADDLHMLYLINDLRAFWGGYWRTGEWTVQSYLRSYAKKKHYRVFDPRDPLPFVRSMAGFVTRRIGRVTASRGKVAG